MPTEWKSSVIIPLYKNKGDVKDCGLYRRIKLLEDGIKIIERVLERSLMLMNHSLVSDQV